jgi:putative transposase
VTFEVREAALEVSEALNTRMHGWLDVLHALYETLRQAREDDRAIGRRVRAGGGAHKYLTQGDQYKHIAVLASRGTALSTVHSQVRQDVACRIERGTRRWLNGDAGPLKPQPRKRYRSFTFPQYGFAVKIRNGRLHMSGLGEARLLQLRKLPGRVKSVRLVFKQGRWFAQFTCEVQMQHCERLRRHASAAVAELPDTGLDTGVAHIATLADGTQFTPAKPLKSALPRLKAKQRKLSRQFEARKREFASYKATFKAQGLCGPLPEKNHLPFSNRLRRQIRRVAVLHTKVQNTRRDQLRKVARRIEQRYRLVAVEEHGMEFMRRNRRMSRAVSDVAPGLFKSILKHALGEHRYVAVGHRRPGIGGNSQTCLCGVSVPKELAQRWHDCPDCGLSADRDTVSGC